MSNPAASHLPWIVSEAARSHGVLFPGRPRNVISPGGVFPDVVTDTLSLFEPVGVVSCKQQLPIASPSTAVDTRSLDPGMFGLDDRSSRKQPTARGSPAGSSSRPAKGDPCDPGNSTRAGARPTNILLRHPVRKNRETVKIGVVVVHSSPPVRRARASVTGWSRRHIYGALFYHGRCLRILTAMSPTIAR